VTFHAHVYFSAEQTAAAARLREELGVALPLALGRLHARGGTTSQAYVPGRGPWAAQLSDTVLWLMRHRGEFSVLIHADTANDWEDHTQNTMWLGDDLRLDTRIFSPGTSLRRDATARRSTGG